MNIFERSNLEELSKFTPILTLSILILYMLMILDSGLCTLHVFGKRVSGFKCGHSLRFNLRFQSDLSSISDEIRMLQASHMLWDTGAESWYCQSVAFVPACAMRWKKLTGFLEQVLYITFFQSFTGTWEAHYNRRVNPCRWIWSCHCLRVETVILGCFLYQQYHINILDMCVSTKETGYKTEGLKIGVP